MKSRIVSLYLLCMQCRFSRWCEKWQSTVMVVVVLVPVPCKPIGRPLWTIRIHVHMVVVEDYDYFYCPSELGLRNWSIGKPVCQWTVWWHGIVRAFPLQKGNTNRLYARRCCRPQENLECYLTLNNSQRLSRAWGETSSSYQNIVNRLSLLFWPVLFKCFGILLQLSPICSVSTFKWANQANTQ